MVSYMYKCAYLLFSHGSIKLGLDFIQFLLLGIQRSLGCGQVTVGYLQFGFLNS